VPILILDRSCNDSLGTKLEEHGLAPVKAWCPMMSLCLVNETLVTAQPHFVISTICQSREMSASRGSVLIAFEVEVRSMCEYRRGRTSIQQDALYSRHQSELDSVDDQRPQAAG